MSWNRFFFLGDFGQQQQLQEHEERFRRLATSHSERNRAQVDRLNFLEREVLGLEAAVAALVALLRTKGIASDAEISRALADATTQAEGRHAEREAAKQEAANESRKNRAKAKLVDLRRRRDPD
jgi:hypothetical protein